MLAKILLLPARLCRNVHIHDTQVRTQKVWQGLDVVISPMKSIKTSVIDLFRREGEERKNTSCHINRCSVACELLLKIHIQWSCDKVKAIRCLVSTLFQ